MKKSIAVFYRLAYILFSVWAILESVSFQLSALPVKLLNFTVLADLICMLCILVVVLVSFRRSIGTVLYGLKTACTFLALFALAANLPMLFSFAAGGWVLKILLPFMVLLDHMLFDKNSGLKFWQMLLWLLLAALIAGIIYVIADKFLTLPNPLQLLGLFSSLHDMLELLLNALILTGALYLLDRLFSGELFKDIRSMFGFVFRVLFLLLEAWAFIRLSGLNLRTFLHTLRYYENLINFLCFLCIAAILIVDLIRMNLKSKGSYVFSRIKSCFTVCIVFALVIYHCYVKGSYKPDAVAVVLYYIAPLMMLVDWLFIDNYCHIRGYDPLIWMAYPVVYFLVAALLSYCNVITLYPALRGGSVFICIGIVCIGTLVVGYIFYFIDRVIKRR